MEEIKSGILSGVQIEEEKAKVIAEVADKIKEMDHPGIDPAKKVLGDLMGAGSSVEEEIKEGASVSKGDGSQIADHGVLTGMEISEENAKILSEVTETIEEVEQFEADGTKKSDGIDVISETLAETMGVKPAE